MGGGPPVAGAFNPLSLFAGAETGFIYDLSNAATVFVESNGSSPVTPATNSGVMGTVTDLSGNANSCRSPLDDNRPNWYSAGYADFIAADADYIRSAFTFPQPVTVIASIRLTQASSRVAICGASNMALYQSTAGELSLIASGSNLGPISFSTNEDFVVTFRASGATSRLAKNNNAYITGTNPGGNSLGGIIFGGDFGGSFNSTMRLYRAIGIGRDMTDGEIANSRTWCGTPAGLSL